MKNEHTSVLRERHIEKTCLEVWFTHLQSLRWRHFRWQAVPCFCGELGCQSYRAILVASAHEARADSEMTITTTVRLCS